MNTGNTVSRALLRAAGVLLGPRRPPAAIPTSFRSILVVRQHDQLGDMMCAIPMLRTLRDAWPAASISLVASPVNYEIMTGHPWLARALLYDKKAILRSPGEFSRFRRDLLALRADLAVVPSTVSISLTSGIIARLSGAGVRIGPGRLEFRDNPSEFLYTHPVDLDWSGAPGRHQALRNADILRPLDLEPSLTPYVLGLTAGEDARAAAILAAAEGEGHPLFGIHPGAAKPGNRWPAERFAAVARALHAEYGNTLVVTVGPRDDEVYRTLAPMLDVPHLFVHNEPIRVAAAVINRLGFFLSNDTGPLHIAGALRPPVLGLFGPTDPREWAPPGEKNHYIAGRDGSVASITVREVVEKCRSVLQGVAGPSDRPLSPGSPGR